MSEETPIWTHTASFYQTKAGVHEPWACEISPYQYASMGKRAQAAYDRKRSAEFEASGACKADFAQLVIAAFLAGEFKHSDQGVSDDAKQIVLRHLVNSKKEDRAARLKAARIENTLTIADLKVGDRVYHIIYGYGLVMKVNRKSAQFKIEDSERVMKCGEGTFQTYSYDYVEKRIC